MSLISRLKNINDSKQTIQNPFLNFGKQLLKETFHLGVDYSNYFNPDFKVNAKTETTVFSNTLNQQLKNDYNGNLKSFLKCEDRCSMAFGIESRVPFADDVELVNYIFSIEGTKKIKNGVSKYLLREAAKQYIPEKIYSRTDKIGFETPVSKWFINHKTEMLEVISQQLDFVNHSFLFSNFNTLIDQKPSFLLRLYSLAIWKKAFNAI